MLHRATKQSRTPQIASLASVNKGSLAMTMMCDHGREDIKNT